MVVMVVINVAVSELVGGGGDGGGEEEFIFWTMSCLLRCLCCCRKPTDSRCVPTSLVDRKYTYFA